MIIDDIYQYGVEDFGFKYPCQYWVGIAEFYQITFAYHVAV